MRGEVSEFWCGNVTVRWKTWTRADGLVPERASLMWEIEAPTEQGVVRLGRRVAREFHETAVGKPREPAGPKMWTILGVVAGDVEEMTRFDAWFREVKAVIDERQ